MLGILFFKFCTLYDWTSLCTYYKVPVQCWVCFMILLAKDNSFHIYVISTQIPVYNIDMKSSVDTVKPVFLNLKCLAVIILVVF